MNHLVKISVLLIQLLCQPSFASEDLTLEKDFSDSYQIAKIITHTLKFKKQGKVKGQVTLEALLPLALAGEIVEKITVAYNLNNECKIIFKTKSYTIESAYPKKKKCMDLYDGI